MLVYYKYLYTAIKKNFKYWKASCRILKYFTMLISKVVKEIRCFSQFCLAFKILDSHVVFREVSQRAKNQNTVSIDLFFLKSMCVCACDALQMSKNQIWHKIVCSTLTIWIWNFPHRFMFFTVGPQLMTLMWRLYSP